MRPARLLLPALVALAGIATQGGALASGASPAPAPSGIGDDSAYAFAISPAYLQTGLVLAAAMQASNCPKSGCARHLWRSHDGGASWSLAQSPPGWVQEVPTIAVDALGHESLFAQGDGGVQRSDDSGRTWHRVGGSGIPVASPAYPSDGQVAVVGGSDYVLKGGSAHPITASGGALVETGLSFASSYPRAGKHAPALLSGLDRKTNKPYVQTCTADLACGGSSPLPAPSQWSNIATLALSSGFDSDGVVFAEVGQTAIYKSVDGGRSFTPLTVVTDQPTYLRVPMLALPVDYRESGPVRTVYAAVLEVYENDAAASSHQSPVKVGGGIYRSGDGGLSWSRLGKGTPLDGGAQAVAVAPDGRLFASYLSGTAGQNGLLCSTDGATWQALCPRVGHWSEASGSSAGSAGGASALGGGAAGRTGGTQSAGGTAAEAVGGGTTGGGGAGSLVGKVSAGSGGGMLIAAAAVLVLVGISVVAVLFKPWRRLRAS